MFLLSDSNLKCALLKLYVVFSLVLTRSVLWLALPPSVPSTHHSRHPSPLRSFIPDLKPSFSANPPHHSLPFLLHYWLHGFPGLFTDTLSISVFYFLVFLFFHFLVFGSMQLIKLTNVTFWAHVKIASRIASCCICTLPSALYYYYYYYYFFLHPR